MENAKLIAQKLIDQEINDYLIEKVLDYLNFNGYNDCDETEMDRRVDEVCYYIGKELCRD